jgi:hypothetical protein
LSKREPARGWSVAVVDAGLCIEPAACFQAATVAPEAVPSRPVTDAD